MILLTCENLTLGYGSRVVVRNLSFTVGAGKSTLIKTSRCRSALEVGE